MSTREVNFDGLVGPTHNYGGLSLGNVASMQSGGGTSNPRAAVKQGLAKMQAMLDLGLEQGLLPPHERPHMPTLRAFGFTGKDAEIVEHVAKKYPALLNNLSSASAMWTANAGTVAPSADTEDGRLHLTPANLSAMTHRSIEHPFTSRLFRTLFPSDSLFSHHPAVPGGGTFGDEGAANHGRLCAHHGAPGLHLFVYGRSAFEQVSGWRFQPRQAREVSEAVARLNGVMDKSVFGPQSRTAIEAGAFHNDVVAVANETVLFYHQDAFQAPDKTLDAIRRRASELGFEPHFIEVPRSAVSLQAAISSYLFNSQLVSLPDGTMALIAPADAEENESTRAYVETLVGGNGPIRAAHFFDLKQSMKNGGGPACLRLRIVMTPEERAATHSGAFVDHNTIVKLNEWADKNYRDSLSAKDLGDPDLLVETRTALDELTALLGLGALYDFQRP
ncbi:MAG: N-succinylarginine dihydrolase [Parvularcula sp.]